jgi:hypothetical protein
MRIAFRQAIGDIWSVVSGLLRSYEVACESYLAECRSLASVTFDADTKVSRFDRSSFPQSGSFCESVDPL